MKTRAWTIMTALALALPAAAADWPQWRGPNRDDVSQETGLLKTWPKSGPKLAWTFEDAGVGYSSFSVVGDRLYTVGGDGKQDFVFALDLATSPPRKVWSTAIGPYFKNNFGDGPRGTPTVDGKNIYVLGAGGDLVCVQADNGKEVWRTNLKDDFGGEMMSGWGYSESVLVDGDKVLCTPGGAQGTLAALDKNTGKALWRSKDWTDKAAYSSIVPATIAGVKQYVQMADQNVGGVGEDGKLLWKQSFPTKVAAIPTPVVQGDHVFATADYGAGCILIKVSKGGAGLKAEKVYASKDMENHHGGVLVIGDHLYGCSGNANGKNARINWRCLDLLTGKVLWSEGREKLSAGSIVAADGHLFLYGQENGTCVMLAASPEGWQEQGRFTIPKETKRRQYNANIWAHPVVANGKLFLRDQELIWCYDVKAGGQ